jgi:hypothetical protein
MRVGSSRVSRRQGDERGSGASVKGELYAQTSGCGDTTIWIASVLTTVNRNMSFSQPVDNAGGGTLGSDRTTCFADEIPVTVKRFLFCDERGSVMADDVVTGKRGHSRSGVAALSISARPDAQVA